MLMLWPDQEVVYVGDRVPVRARVVRPLWSHCIIRIAGEERIVPMELLREPPVRLVATRPDEDDALPRGAA
jgi:hypothetical protein